MCVREREKCMYDEIEKEVGLADRCTTETGVTSVSATDVSRYGYPPPRPVASFRLFLFVGNVQEVPQAAHISSVIDIRFQVV